MIIQVFQHVPFEHPGTIVDWAKEHQHQINYTLFYEKHTLPKPDSFDLLIILGGPMSVNDTENHKWLTKEIEFIQTCIQKKKKIIGICLGSQLLAKSLGAAIHKNNLKEIGFFPLTKTFSGSKNKLAQTLPDTWPMYHWHGETFDIPEHCQNLYSSKACKHQMFMHGDHCIGMQFHPEVNHELLKAMLENGEKELNERLYVQNKTAILNHPFDYKKQKEIFFQLLQNFIKDET
jgi:GMP synthase-like glutamine amidotransferase